MIIKNSYIKTKNIDDVKYVLAKDNLSNKLYKIDINAIKVSLGFTFDIVAFFGKKIPPGLLLLDGKLYKNEDYPELSKEIGRMFCLPDDPIDMFRVPDLVTGNRFLMGEDGIDYVAAGSLREPSINYIYCEDTILNHTHPIVSRHGITGFTTGLLPQESNFYKDTAYAETDEVGSDETAGKSMAVNFCIRTGSSKSKIDLTRVTTGNEVRETTDSQIRIIDIAK